MAMRLLGAVGLASPLSPLAAPFMAPLLRHSSNTCVELCVGPHKSMQVTELSKGTPLGMPVQNKAVASTRCALAMQTLIRHDTSGSRMTSGQSSQVELSEQGQGHVVLSNIRTLPASARLQQRRTFAFAMPMRAAAHHTESLQMRDSSAAVL